ncbi:Uncharacterised protein [Salmonella enterica]|nr:Uncharacterised protein [Salmonella enterica]
MAHENALVSCAIFDAKALVWWLLRRFTGCMKTSLLSEAGRRAGLRTLMKIVMKIPLTLS